MRYLLNGKEIELQQPRSSNPACPACGHHNAMLLEEHTYDETHCTGYILKCRDCGTKVTALTS